ncbi:hypothetical protein PENNAL_c0004G01802 [Penicillium nalgiovense]|uniref:Uncharacterized protein n=1 Tax=Penicillium nalgiovense TaxID=60175 RepID=A0A1V6Z3J8_PENNA|nr:hypothetical protein PENNAL_c0004G01802 [Penicillium nalgiovense]
MSTSKRTLEGLEHSKEKRVCRPAPLKLKALANSWEGVLLKINGSSKTAPTELVNGDNLSPRLVQELGQPSPIPHALLNKSLSINESSEATPTQGSFLFSGTQEKAQPTVEFNPRLPTPKNGASNTVNVNWPLPYTRIVGPVNEDGFAVVTQTWYDYSSMTDSDSQSSGSPRSFHFDPRSFPPPRTRTRVQYFGRPDGRARKKPRFIMGFCRGCPQCNHRVLGHRNHVIFA